MTSLKDQGWKSGKSSVDPTLLEDEDATPAIETISNHLIVRMPVEIQQASEIVVHGRRIKSLLFSTDIAIIRNNDADAIFCVYPFIAQRAVHSAVIHAASAPVFCGAGGSSTQGMRAVYLAMDAESQGAAGVVFNSPLPNRDLRAVARVVSVPIVATVSRMDYDVTARIESGASIINVAAGERTPELVAKVRAEHPHVPIIATGGTTGETILETIEAGANAIVYTPPSSADLHHALMATYR